MRTSLVGTTVLAAVATALVLPAGSAWAEGDDTEAPKIVSVSAPSIVGMTADGAVFRINVKVTDDVDISDTTGAVTVGVLDRAGKVGRGFPAKLVKGMSWDGTYRAEITLPLTAPLGGWSVLARAVDTSGNNSTGVNEVRDSFTLKYATRIAKLNAGPEPAVKGKPMTVTGTLQQAVTGGWAAYAGKAVKVQFRKKGTSTWVTVAKATSASTGKFSLVTKATAAGDWRGVYAGNATRAKSTSKSDAVALTK